MKKLNKNIYQGKTKVILQLILILSFCIFIQTSSALGYSLNSTKTTMIKSYIENEYFIEWDSGRELRSPHLYPSGTVFVNYTVLANSYSNVSFITFLDNGITWSPLENNFTLIPGESFSQTFTMVNSDYDNIAALFYGAYVLTENSNATVCFGYNVITSGTDSISLPTGILLSGFIVLSGTILIIRKKGNRSH